MGRSRRRSWPSATRTPGGVSCSTRMDRPARRRTGITTRSFVGSLGRFETMITDVHVHLEPYEAFRPAVRKVMFDRIPDIERACLINYVAPEVMGFTEDANRYVGEFAREDRKRLIPFGSVHPRRTKNPKRDVEQLASKWEMGGMKIHPPHQLFAANAYADGKLPALRRIYQTAERLRMPVMIHTGTSIFPGARSKYGDPMAIDDVAQDFPDLTIIMAHGGRPLWCDTAFYLLRRH